MVVNDEVLYDIFGNPIFGDGALDLTQEDPIELLCMLEYLDTPVGEVEELLLDVENHVVHIYQFVNLIVDIDAEFVVVQLNTLLDQAKISILILRAQNLIKVIPEVKVQQVHILRLYQRLIHLLTVVGPHLALQLTPEVRILIHYRLEILPADCQAAQLTYSFVVKVKPLVVHNLETAYGSEHAKASPEKSLIVDLVANLVKSALYK